MFFLVPVCPRRSDQTVFCVSEDNTIVLNTYTDNSFSVTVSEQAAWGANRFSQLEPEKSALRLI